MKNNNSNENTTNLLTGYALAKLCNVALTEAGLSNIPPQMVYTYIKKGYIPSQDVNGQKLVTDKDGLAWIESYVAGRVAKDAKKVEQVESELAGQ